jgi:organic hydroperoxide reductase OsmC/OhrA
MITEIELTPTVVVRSDADAEKAKRLLIKAEENCLISYSMKTKTTLFPVIQVKE